LGSGRGVGVGVGLGEGAVEATATRVLGDAVLATFPLGPGRVAAAMATRMATAPMTITENRRVPTRKA
jgi:hypothetical protein